MKKYTRSTALIFTGLSVTLIALVALITTASSPATDLPPLPTRAADFVSLPDTIALADSLPPLAGDSGSAGAGESMPLPEMPAIQPEAPAAPLPVAQVESPATRTPVPSVEPVVIEVPQQPVPDQVVIRFDPAATEQERQAYIASIGGTVMQDIVALDTVVVNVPDATAVQAMPSNIVAQSEPDFFVSALIDVPTSDPYYPQQWALPVIGAPDAWLEMPADAPKVTVAVIDSGVCADHPDLAGRVLAGWDFVENDPEPQDAFGHGCGVAGIIAANIDDGVGMAGVAPNAMILPLRVLDASGIGTYSNVAAAIVRAVDDGAQVINLSLGGAYPSTVLQDAIDYAVARNVWVIAAAGNTGGSVLWPAAYEPVVAVGSVDQNLERSSFSSYGPEIDLWAPGRDVLVTANGGAYQIKSGTSFAAPYVSGTAIIELAMGRTLVLDVGIAEIHTSIPSQSITSDLANFSLLTPTRSITDNQGSDLGNVTSELRQLYANWSTATPQTVQSFESNGIELLNDRVKVLIIALDDTSAESVLIALTGLRAEVTARYKEMINAWLPITAIPEVSALPGVTLVGLPVAFISNDILPQEVVSLAGQFETQGVGLSNAQSWHEADLHGQGVKIGVIDTGFFGYEAAKGSELPENLISINPRIRSMECGVEVEDRHGTAVTQIIYDMADQAQIAITSATTPEEFAQTLRDLSSQGYQVISSSVGWVGYSPGDGTGVIEKAINEIAPTTLYVQAAGNFRLSHLDDDFRDQDGNSFHEFTSGVEVLEFGFPLFETRCITITLRWDDWNEARTGSASGLDYDLELVGWSARTGWEPILQSEVRQSTHHSPPVEILQIRLNGLGGTGTYGIRIKKHFATRGALMSLYVAGVDLQNSVPARSLADNAAAREAFSVAALDISNLQKFAAYSSRGPAYGSGGTRQIGNAQPRISAYAAVLNPTINPFRGTSAAAPHVAGAAALVLSAFPDFTPAEIRTFLEKRALDMGGTDYNYDYGEGRLWLGPPPVTPTPDPEDTTPPNGTWISPANGGTFGTSVRLSGEASDVESGIKEVRFTAYWNGGPSSEVWHVVTRQRTPQSDNVYSYTWDLCAPVTLADGRVVTIPNGSITLGMDVENNAGLTSYSPHGTRTITKNADCGGGGTPGNWTASYYSGTNRWFDNSDGSNLRCTASAGGPELVRDYGDAAPCSGMIGDLWVGDYQATVNFPSGNYVFWVEHDNGLKLWLNQQNIADRGDRGSGWVCPARPLSGNVNLRAMLREDFGQARAKVQWFPDTGQCNTANLPSWLLEWSKAEQPPLEVDIHIRVQWEPGFDAFRICFDGQNCQETPATELYYTWNTYGWPDGNVELSVEYRRLSDNQNWANALRYTEDFYLSPSRGGVAPCDGGEGATLQSGSDCMVYPQFFGVTITQAARLTGRA